MPDDEDAKVRRNLVAFASAIILLAWLALPMELVSDRLLGLSGAAQYSVPQKRVWLAVGVVLAYLVLRYRFSAFHKTAMEDWAKEWQEVDRGVLSGWIRMEAKAMSQWNTLRPPLLGGLSGVLSQVAIPERQTIPKLGRCTVQEVEYGSWASGRHVPSKIQVTVALQPFERTSAGMRPLPALQMIVRLGPTARTLKFIAAATRLAAYSQSTIVLFTPWMLAALAGAIVARRLWQVW